MQAGHISRPLGIAKGLGKRSKVSQAHRVFEEKASPKPRVQRHNEYR